MAEESGADPADRSDPVIGKVLSERYRVERKLGEGGMGAVYLAEHVLIQKRVALKILAPELTRREELAARFLQEARAASRIGQENVIDISDFGRSEGLVYFVMEYLEGQDLGALLRATGAIGWTRARGIVLQICKALRAAHGKGIIHRDLKPENVFLLVREGEPDFVKLLDFGIAKVSGEGLAGEAEGPRLTRTGMIFGTPEYMAPEQAEGKAPDHRVDLYAVGCLLYHCLTGSTPFSAETFMGMLSKHLIEIAVPPSQRKPGAGITPAIDALVAKALEKDRERRFASADDFMAAINAIPAGVDTTGGGRATQLFGTGASQEAVRVAALAPEFQVPRTEVVGPAETRKASGSAAAVLEDATPGRKNRVVLLAAVGLALGVGGAAALAFRGGGQGGGQSPAANAPAANAPAPEPAAPAAAPAQAAAAAIAPAVDAGAAAAAPPPIEEPAPASIRTRHEAKRPHRPAPPPPTTPAPPTPTPPGPKVPSELKPFPE